jgi:hypothetical protein
VQTVFFFFGAKFCQNENKKIKKEYYVTIFSLSLFKKWSNFEEKYFELFLATLFPEPSTPKELSAVRIEAIIFNNALHPKKGPM